MAQADRLARIAALAVPAALLAGAYIAQYVFGLPPCEMCWWQRYPHFLALALALIAFLRPQATLLVWLAAGAIAVSGLIGAYHAGVEYKWWEGMTACTATPAATSAEALEAILNAPLVRCDVAPWSLFGISLAGWNFLISLTAALGIAWLLSGKRKERP
jgi:disulfide bond formation protein DsbB